MWREPRYSREEVTGTKGWLAETPEAAGQFAMRWGCRVRKRPSEIPVTPEQERQRVTVPRGRGVGPHVAASWMSKAGVAWEAWEFEERSVSRRWETLVPRPHKNLFTNVYGSVTHIVQKADTEKSVRSFTDE